MAMDMISGAAAPAMMDAGPPDPGAGGSNADAQAAEILGQMLDLGTQYMSIEPDEEDKAVVAQCLSQLQKIRAKDQQDADKMTQGNVTSRALRAALS